MKLNKNWLTEKHIDLEYKQYILLAYLKEVENKFNQIRLFPYYSDLEGYNNDLNFIMNNIDNLYNQFPKNIIDINLEKIKLIYDNDNNNFIKILKDIIEFSLSKFKHYINKGKDVYNFVKKRIQIEPVGLIPLNLNEGYILLKNNNVKNVLVYYYSSILYNNLKTEFIGNYKYGFINTFENIKRLLIKKYNNIPNPATYSIISDIKLPLTETFIPISREMILKNRKLS